MLNDIINLIIASGLATKKDKDIFKDYVPKNADNCIIVYEYGGSGMAPFTDTSVRSIQIVVKSKESKFATEKINSIFKLFHSSESQFLTIGERACIIQCRNTPIKIGVDEQGKKMYAFNLGITATID